MDEDDLERSRQAYREWKQANDEYLNTDNFDGMNLFIRRHGDFLQDFVKSFPHYARDKNIWQMIKEAADNS